MKSKIWKYWRISRHEVEDSEAAKRVAPKGLTYCGCKSGQFIFRRPKGVPGARA